MSDEEDYDSEEDLDYVPCEGEQVSEEENSGDEEDLALLLDENTESKGKGKRKPGGVKKKNAIQQRKRQGGIKLDESDQSATVELKVKEKEESAEEAQRKKELAEQIVKEEEEKKKEREKKRADDLWSSFMSGVKQPPKRTPTTTVPAQSSLASLSKTESPREENAKSTPVSNQPEKSGKMTITKVFDFAGEEIKITKEVDVNSKEAKAEQKKLEKANQEMSDDVPKQAAGSSILPGMKRPAVGGLGSVLNKINKKNKMGTLEKSKMDWDSFKKKEGIEEDLKIHNKGKQGYTERMAFLNRADQRQYEIERDLRLGNTSKR